MKYLRETGGPFPNPSGNSFLKCPKCGKTLTEVFKKLKDGSAPKKGKLLNAYCKSCGYSVK
jgi:C4-type Zn-finger protein